MLTIGKRRFKSAHVLQLIGGILMVMLLSSILAPLVVAPASLLTRKWRLGALVATGVLSVSCALLFYSTVQAFSGRIQAEIYPVEPALALIELQGDGFNLVFADTVALLGVVNALYSGEYMQRHSSPGLYFSLYLIYVSAMLGAVTSGSLMTFFLFFELMLLPSTALIALWGTDKSRRAALGYLLFNEVGALFTTLGIAMVYDSYGVLSFDALRVKLSSASPLELLPIATLLCVGPLVKMAVVPLHVWLPDAHSEAPTPISALLSPAAIGIGGWALARILLYTMRQVPKSYGFRAALMLMGLVTAVYGGLCALVQDDLKRLLAYSSVSQMGYMLMGIASASEAGVVGAALLYVSHGFAKASLFLTSGTLQHELETRRISQMSGLAGAMPLLAVSALIAFLCLAGVPPVIGFWAELCIFAGILTSALQASPVALACTIAAIVAASTLTTAYSIWTFKRVFLGRPLKKSAHKRISSLALAPLALSCTAAVLGVYPAPLMQLASSIMH